MGRKWGYCAHRPDVWPAEGIAPTPARRHSRQSCRAWCVSAGGSRAQTRQARQLNPGFVSRARLERFALLCAEEPGAKPLNDGASVISSVTWDRRVRSRPGVVSQFEMLALHSPRFDAGAHYLVQPFNGFQCFRRFARVAACGDPPRPTVTAASATPIGASAPAAGMGTWPTEPFVTSHSACRSTSSPSGHRNGRPGAPWCSSRRSVARHPIRLPRWPGPPIHGPARRNRPRLRPCGRPRPSARS